MVKSLLVLLSSVPALVFMTSARAAAPIPPPPAIEARAYLLIDADSGQQLAALKADDRVEPASITKLMTAYVVFHALKDGRLNINDTATVSEHAWRAEGSRTFLDVGTQVPVDILLKGMIVQSGNDATITLAEKVGGTEPAFVDMMNSYAKQLGLSNTHYDDSSGLPSPTHFSSARDIVTLSRAIIREFPDRYPLFSLREFTWNKIHQPNRDGLLMRDPSVDGLKTGHTDSAGYCLVSSARRQSTRLIAVVLGTRSERAREDAVAALLNYGFTFYESLPLKKAGEKILQPRVFRGAANSVGVGTSEAVNVTIPRGQAGGVATSATLQQPLIAPLSRTRAVGELQVSVAGTLVRRVALYPLSDVPAAGFFGRLYDTIVLWFH
jgi:serine-type D-Ala-D-Ala carboxypeptidase (penicillin-binding protein 5/6)